MMEEARASAVPRMAEKCSNAAAAMASGSEMVLFSTCKEKMWFFCFLRDARIRRKTDPASPF